MKTPLNRRRPTPTQLTRTASCPLCEGRGSGRRLCGWGRDASKGFLQKLARQPPLGSGGWVPGHLADAQSPKALRGSQAPGGELLANLRDIGSGQAASEVAKVPQGAPRGGGSPSRPSPRTGSDARKRLRAGFVGFGVACAQPTSLVGHPPGVGRSPTPPPKWGRAPLHRPNDWPTEKPTERAETTLTDRATDGPPEPQARQVGR